mgnify:FL=1
MLSILIPTFNFDSVPLVKELHRQCIGCGIEFEILVYDDGSKSAFSKSNSTINTLQNCTFKELPNNIGRSAIRNLLAKNAKYDLLLFVDSGTFPKTPDFIEKYLSIDNKNVKSGGMTHLEHPPKKPYKLRWLYTKKREFKTLCSSNFMIRKEIFISNQFDESLKKYGFEDVLFFDTLLEKKIPIFFFNNPVEHNADDDATTFLKKTEYAMENLYHLIKDNKAKKEGFNITKAYQILKKIRLHKIIAFNFKLIKPLLIMNLKSNYPSLLLFDFYKLGYLCSLKK